ncbi:hypothetical protein [Nocardia goodfellowii]|uniref:EfeO-type cupredoxin-like domain-containing protein n=1 Tax=Nocardia goodfellowii TaxID=882446 RepID=A0ABS4QF80_9NOCA|nr:hypothetical protein [Nocardia goodfellowii]MBP2189743.1 hypothetical protein [Nocardia goodfellowii]
MSSKAALGMAVVAAATLVSSCTTTSEGPATVPDRPSATGTAAAATTVAIRIASGAVTPTNSRTDATVGQPILLLVDSDAADELHVHADPAHTFTVEPRAGQEFRFTISVPGQVEVELHHAGKTVTTLQVRP